MFPEIAMLYGLPANNWVMEPIGSGLIHATWKVITAERMYVLQKINRTVFEEPAAIASNIAAVSAYVAKHFPDYLFVSPLKARNGEEIVHTPQGDFRLFPFINGSHTIDVVRTQKQAYEAAVQFGRFTNVLADFDAHQLHTTIPCFHDLATRYRKFIEAIEQATPQRRESAAALIQEIAANAGIVNTYLEITANKEFIIRVAHHDTKITNVLFDAQGEGLCVIDLDTIMPGYFISDVGDMLRTYLSPVSEDEAALEKIMVREDVYHAVVNGYNSQMRDQLTTVEKTYFFFAGQFMIYMQAMRFLTDHLGGNHYYKEHYPGQNLARTRNQLQLLRLFMAKKSLLAGYIPQ